MRNLKTIVFRKYPRPPEVQAGDRAKWYIVRHPDALQPLKYWLLSREYHSFTEGLDDRGNTLLNLTYESDVLGARCLRDRGIIAVWERSLIKPVKALIEDHMV